MGEKRKIGLFDLVLVILERKRIFIISMLLFSVGGVVTSLLMTKVYQATAVVLPPKQSSASTLGSLLGDIPGSSGLLRAFDFLSTSSTDAYLSILGSTRLAKSVIDKFDLAAYYGFKKKKRKYFTEDVLKALSLNVGASEDKYGNIQVSVTDTNPSHAAEIANFIVDELDRINYELSKESAKNSRLFFSDRLAVIKADLDTALRRMTEFKTRNNYIDLEQQTVSSIEALSKLEAEKMALELERDQVRSKFGSTSQRVRELDHDLSVLRGRIDYYMGAGSGDLIISLKDAPQKSVEYAYLYRDVKIQESLYQFAMQMFEQAKFKEANNTPTVQILSRAEVPEKRLRPRRRIVCMLFFFSGLAATTIGILAMKWHAVQKENRTEAYSRLQQLIAALGFGK